MAIKKIDITSPPNSMFQGITTNVQNNITYAEFLLGVLKKLNEMIPIVNKNSTFVNHYQGEIEEIQRQLVEFNEEWEQYKINTTQEFDQQILDFENAIRTELASMTNQIDAISMSPLTASSTSEMTDTTRVYVNTTDGHWYSWDGEEWVDGGVYNATAIADGSIDILMLDEMLQNSKVVTYGDFMTLGVQSGGIARENSSTHKVEISSPTSTDYSWYKVALTKGKIYQFTGYNYGAVGMILADSEDNVKFWSVSNPTSYVLVPYSTTFKVNESGMNVYISIKNSYYADTYKSALRANTPRLKEISGIYNLIKKLTPKKLADCDDHYLSITHVQGSDDTLAVYQNYENIDLKIYEMNKGVKYRVHSTDWSFVCGIYILKLDNTILYQSSTETTGTDYVPCDYTFTAEEDGYICVHDFHLSESAIYNGSVEIVHENIGSTSDVSFSKWIAMGDSLTEKNFRASKNYVDYIQEELNVDVQNTGVSGAGYMKTTNANKNFRTEIDTIDGFNPENTVITVMGSINDFSYIANELGQLGDIGTDTLYGCMWNFFNKLQNSYVGTRIGVITPPVIGSSYEAQLNNFNAYNTALKETAKKFGIPVLDLTYSCNLKPWVQSFRETYYLADGTGASGQVDNVHPNSKGHWFIHSKIREFLKNL